MYVSSYKFIIFIFFFIYTLFLFFFFLFFFQAEDGIRDLTVTGVQTWLFRSEVLRGRGNGGRGRVMGRVAHVHLGSPPVVRAEVYPSRGPSREGLGASFRRGGLLDI